MHVGHTHTINNGSARTVCIALCYHGNKYVLSLTLRVLHAVLPRAFHWLVACDAFDLLAPFARCYSTMLARFMFYVGQLFCDKVIQFVISFRGEKKLEEQ